MVDEKNNSGKNNSGRGNSGNCNSGYYNSGGYNSGNGNPGYNNSGHWNSGNDNSGSRNSGDWNSGYDNSGNYNSGNSNSGSGNSGSWNACDRESGHFNVESAKTIRVFHRECPVKVWDDAVKPEFLYFDLDENLGYKESFQKSYDELTDEQKQIQTEQLKKLPNFDAGVFYEISGIDIV
jgi:hypothetical protein